MLSNIYFDQVLRARRAKIVLNDTFSPPDLSKIPEGMITPTMADTNIVLKSGEASDIEFKETARWSIRDQRVLKDIEQGIVKTVAAFLNTKGGVLLIGVNDDGVPVGLSRDIAVTGNKGLDGFENWLIGDLFRRYLGSTNMLNVEARFEVIDGLDVCRVDVSQSRKPIFTQSKPKNIFYIRIGNSTHKLSSEDSEAYIKEHFE